MSPYAKGESQTEIDESIERLLMRAKSKHFCFFFIPVGLTRKGKMASSALYNIPLLSHQGRVWISESKVYRAAAGFVNNKI